MAFAIPFIQEFKKPAEARQIRVRQVCGTLLRSISFHRGRSGGCAGSTVNPNRFRATGDAADGALSPIALIVNQDTRLFRLCIKARYRQKWWRTFGAEAEHGVTRDTRSDPGGSG